MKGAEPGRPAPVVVLGVSRSGTTLLKEMLDRHSQLAIPTESYFIPQLWDRHGPSPDREAILADLERIARVREWGVTADDVRVRLPAEASFADVVGAVYGAYADARGKPRFGDKTPSYMQQLDLLDRVWPDAQFVHIVRDGRDAALSFLAMRRRPRFNWARPRGLGDFACQWDLEVRAARGFGSTAARGRYFEVRYEDLVARSGAARARSLRLPRARLRAGDARVPPRHRREHARDHPRLAQPPTAGLRAWRTQMAQRDVERFEAITGPLLGELGYPRAFPAPSGAARTRAALERAAFRARLTTWDGALELARRSPAWPLRQVYIRRTSPEAPVRGVGGGGRSRDYHPET